MFSYAKAYQKHRKVKLSGQTIGGLERKSQKYVKTQDKEAMKHHDRGDRSRFELGAISRDRRAGMLSRSLDL